MNPENNKPKKELSPNGGRGSGSRKNNENLERIDKMVNDSFFKISVSNGLLVDSKDTTIDVGLWKNMIFYKSIATVQQHRKKLDSKGSA